MERVISGIILVLVCCLGIIIGNLYATKKYYIQADEVLFWKEQCNKLMKYNEKKFKTIASKHEEAIRYWFNEGLTDKQIAEKIGCGKSTIQRAVKQFGLR